MGLASTADRMMELAEQMTIDAQEREHLRDALRMCLPFARNAMDHARDVEKFKAARSAYRMGCAALGMDHE
jgi:hypothetical protein